MANVAQHQQNVANVAEHNLANVAGHWFGGWTTKGHVMLIGFGVLLFLAACKWLLWLPRTKTNFLVGLLYAILCAFVSLVSLFASLIDVRAKMTAQA